MDDTSPLPCVYREHILPFVSDTESSSCGSLHEPALLHEPDYSRRRDASPFLIRAH